MVKSSILAYKVACAWPLGQAKPDPDQDDSISWPCAHVELNRKVISEKVLLGSVSRTVGPALKILEPDHGSVQELLGHVAPSPWATARPRAWPPHGVHAIRPVPVPWHPYKYCIYCWGSGHLGYFRFIAISLETSDPLSRWSGYIS